MSTLSRALRRSLHTLQPVMLRARDPLLPRRVFDTATTLLSLAYRLPGSLPANRTRLAGVPVLHLRNPDAGVDPGRQLVYIHGGGFSFGNPDSHRHLATRLMREGGFAGVWLPDYRRTPQHPFPAAPDDCLAAVRVLQRQGHDLVLAGDSAGANLCVVTTLALRDAGDTLPSALVLLSPWLDVAMDPDDHGGYRDTFAGRRVGRASRWIRILFSDGYAGTRDARHPAISPVFADLRGLPPTFVQSGSEELFLSGSLRFHASATAAGSPSRLDVVPGMFHAFQLLVPVLPEAATAVRRAADWLAWRRIDTPA